MTAINDDEVAEDSIAHVKVEGEDKDNQKINVLIYMNGIIHGEKLYADLSSRSSTSAALVCEGLAFKPLNFDKLVVMTSKALEVNNERFDPKDYYLAQVLSTVSGPKHHNNCSLLHDNFEFVHGSSVKVIWISKEADSVSGGSKTTPLPSAISYLAAVYERVKDNEEKLKQSKFNGFVVKGGNNIHDVRHNCELFLKDVWDNHVPNEVKQAAHDTAAITTLLQHQIGELPRDKPYSGIKYSDDERIPITNPEPPRKDLLKDNVLVRPTAAPQEEELKSIGWLEELMQHKENKDKWEIKNIEALKNYERGTWFSVYQVNVSSFPQPTYEDTVFLHFANNSLPGGRDEFAVNLSSFVVKQALPRLEQAALPRLET
jgi:hypothetical protein